MQLLIEDRISPVDLEPGTPPTLRWRYEPTDVGRADATAFQVVVADDDSLASSGKGTVWDSGRRIGDGSRGCRLDGVPTVASRRYWVSLRLWDDKGQPGGWSSPMTFGFGAGSHWVCHPIWCEDPVEKDDVAEDDGHQGMEASGNSCGWAFMTTCVKLPDRPIRWATLNATAASTRGSRQFVYRAWLNGRFVGCGPTFPIDDETRYDGFDVTAMLWRGANRISVIAYAMQDRRFAAQLDVGFDDGTVMTLGTGHEWKAMPGWNVYPDSKSIGSQYFNAPAENLRTVQYPEGFFDTEFDDSTWSPASLKSDFDQYKATPTDKLRLIYPQYAQILTSGAHKVVLDFGVAWMGGVRIISELATSLDVTLRFGEVLNDDGSVRFHLSASNTYEDRWRLVAGRHSCETWGIRVFRYVELVSSDSDVDLGQLVISGKLDVSAAALVYPKTDEHASFSCSDAMMNRVWELGRHTVNAFNGNIYVDSWTRERAPYEADAWIQQRSHLALDDAPALGRYSIDYLIHNRTWPTEWPWYLILAVHDAWWRTGSLEQVHRQYDRLRSFLPERYIDENTGFVVKAPGESSVMDGDLVDWPVAERDGFVFGEVNTVINALAAQVYEAMADMAMAIGRRDDAAHMRSRAKRIRAAVNERLYDPGIGAYADGIDKGTRQEARINHYSEHASVFALAFCRIPMRRIPAVTRFLRSRGMVCSVYVASIYLEALYKAGCGVDANRLIAARTGLRTWANMLEQGAGATMEAWDPSLKPNTTYSHPWATSPVFLLPEGVFGIRPTVPGYREFSVIAQPGSLTDATTTVPVATGDVGATFHAKRASASGLDGFAITIRVPAGTIASPVLPALENRRPGEYVQLVVDGVEQERSSLVSPMTIGGVLCPAGSVPLDDMGRGTHVISEGVMD